MSPVTGENGCEAEDAVGWHVFLDALREVFREYPTVL